MQEKQYQLFCRSGQEADQIRETFRAVSAPTIQVSTRVVVSDAGLSSAMQSFFNLLLSQLCESIRIERLK